MSGIQRNEVSWAVEYDDGTVVAQYEKREEDNLEVPLRTIEWGRVRRVLFESQDMTYSYVLPLLMEGFKWSMRIRHYRLTGAYEGEVLVMVLLASEEEKEVGDDSVKFALYVTPDGIVHFCDQFNCSHIPDYYMGKVQAQTVSVPQRSTRKQVQTSATVEEINDG